MAKINDIVKAKLSDKSDMPDWYYKRLEICRSCPLYSLNFKPQTIPEKTRYAALSAANLGEPFCWKCGCEVTAKASLAGEECPNTPQRWRRILSGQTSIDIEDKEYSLTNLSIGKVAMSSTGAEFIFDYGDIDYDSDTKISVLISPKTKEDFINLKPSSSCGCTVPTVKREGKDIIMEIEYDSKRVGDFSKLVTLGYSAGRENQIVLRIKGKVIK